MTGASGRGGMVDDNEQGASSILFLNLTGEIANRKTFRDMNRQTGSMDKFFTPRLLSSTSSVQTDGAVLNTKINDDGNVKKNIASYCKSSCNQNQDRMIWPHHRVSS